MAAILVCLAMQLFLHIKAWIKALSLVFVQEALVKPCENLHALFLAYAVEGWDEMRGPSSMKSR